MITRTTLSAILAAGLAAPPLLAQTTPQTPPAPPIGICEDEARYRVFDFWIGDWDVYADEDRTQKVGRNVITKEMDGCFLRELWTSANGIQGESINYLDPQSGTWKQNWVSQIGGVVRYEGTFSDGAMRMEGVSIAPDGTAEEAQVVWTPIEGGVKHTIRHRKEGGDWYAYFTGYYYPHKEDA